MRHQIIYCLGEGRTLGIMLGNLAPNFTTDMTDPKVFPNKIFEKALFTDAKKKEYMPFVKDEEDWNLGKLNKG